MENYAEQVKNFYAEHIHENEEIPYCLEGSGYVNVGDKEDRWNRIWIKAGDMIAIPARMHHRFSLDTGNYIKLMRFSKGESKWTGHNRPQKDHPVRKSYTNNFINKVGLHA